MIGYMILAWLDILSASFISEPGFFTDLFLYSSRLLIIFYLFVSETSDYNNFALYFKISLYNLAKLSFFEDNYY